MGIFPTTIVAVVYICSLSLTPDQNACGREHHVAVYYGEECTMAPDCMKKATERYLKTRYAEVARHDKSIWPVFGMERRIGVER